MASQQHFATLVHKATGEHYVTRINRKRRMSFAKKDFKLELKKYSKVLRKVVLFIESKKPFGSAKKAA